MSTEEKFEGNADPQPAKKGLLSWPFLIIGALLLAMLCPIGDVIEDE